MAAIGLGRAQVASYLRTGVVIGCDNSPNSTTLTGDADSLEQIMASIKNDQPDVLVRALQVECAYHSRKYPHAFMARPDLLLVTIKTAIDFQFV